MKIVIKHEISGRIRFSMPQRRFSFEEADRLQYYLLSLDGVEKATVYERSADAVVVYSGNRDELLSRICSFDAEAEGVKALVPENTGRELMASYKEKLIGKVILHYGCRFFLPSPIRRIKAWIMATRFIYRGLVSLFKQRKLEVSVLDATAITVSLLTGDYQTASSVMFLLGVGDLLEEWTHKKSVDDLARSMALKSDKVWLRKDRSEVQVPISQIVPGDEISVRVGSVIPLDGVVVSGEALVNQATLTGEGIPVEKKEGAYVYAGTVIEEGDIVLKVEKASGATRYEKIIKMIEESESLKSGVESRAEHLADKLVPYTLGGKLSAVICLEDPLRPEAVDVITKLHEVGFKNIVMMTGDSKHIAKSVAKKVGVDSYYAEVLPEEKAGFIQQEKAKGHTVVMIGDGINDSPALSEADCGIAISEGAQLARQIADVMISEDNLYKLITLKELSELLMKRIHFNYRFVVGFNLGLIALGLFGTIAPATSATLHNGSTIALGLHSMSNLKRYEENREKLI